MPCLFISHSSQDREFVEREIISPLRAHGLDIWYSTDDIQTASEWERQIHKGLMKCDWFLVALSPRAVDSEWVRREVHWAVMKRNNKIIPVMLETCEPEDIHLGLLPIQYIDFRDGAEQAQERLLAVWGLDKATQVKNLYRAAREVIEKEEWAAAIQKLEAVMRLDSTHSQSRADLNHVRKQQFLASLYEEGVTGVRERRWREARETLRRLHEADDHYKDVHELIALAEVELEKEEAERQAREAQKRAAEEIRRSTDKKEVRDRGTVATVHSVRKPGQTKRNTLVKVLTTSIGVIVVLALMWTLWPEPNASQNNTALNANSTQSDGGANHNKMAGGGANHNKMAEALVGQGKYEEAEAETRKAIEFEPNNDKYYNNLGNILLRQGKNKEAEAEFRKAVGLSPDNPDYHDNVGVTLEHQDKVKEAEAEFRKAVELSPDNATYHNNLGLTLQRQNKNKEAEAEFRKAVGLSPDNPDYHNNLGSALQHQGENKEAEAEFRKAIELDPNDGVYHDSLGTTLRRLGKYAEAEAEHRKAIELDPNNADYHFGLALDLHMQKRHKEEAEVTRRALNIESKQ